MKSPEQIQAEKMERMMQGETETQARPYAPMTERAKTNRIKAEVFRLRLEKAKRDQKETI